MDHLIDQWHKLHEGDKASTDIIWLLETLQSCYKQIEALGFKLNLQDLEDYNNYIEIEPVTRKAKRLGMVFWVKASSLPRRLTETDEQRERRHSQRSVRISSNRNYGSDSPKRLVNNTFSFELLKKMVEEMYLYRLKAAIEKLQSRREYRKQKAAERRSQIARQAAETRAQNEAQRKADAIGSKFGLVPVSVNRHSFKFQMAEGLYIVTDENGVFQEMTRVSGQSYVETCPFSTSQIVEALVYALTKTTKEVK